MVNRRVYVVSGVGNNRPGHIIRDLQKMGYGPVIWIKTNTFGTNKIPRDGGMVIGHSRGAWAVENQFGGSDYKGTVISLDSPFGKQYDNVHYSQNILDPVSLLRVVTSPDPTFEGSFISGNLNPHDKNDAWSRIKHVAEKAIQGVDLAHEQALENQRIRELYVFGEHGMWGE
jgi:hypothetical protein